MAIGSSTISNIGGGVGDILSGYSTAKGLRLKAEGARVEAKNYREAELLAGENEEFTKQSTAVKQLMADRQIYLGIGAETAAIAGSGFANSGNAIDLLRSSASQGSIQKQLIGQQGLITEEGFRVQKETYHNLASYADMAANVQDSMAGDSIRNSWISGSFKLAAGFASLF